MKAIIVKLNDKIVLCEQVKEITTKQLLEYQKEAKETIAKKDRIIVVIENEISKISEYCGQLNKKIEDLQHQINVITGVEEESEEHE